MENNKLILKEDLEEYLYFKSLKVTNKDSVSRMQNFLNKHIDNKAVICKTCSAQIRFYYQMILNWGIRMDIENIDFKKEKEERKEKQIFCIRCNNIINTTTDKKRLQKYCGQECERIYKDKKYGYGWYDENGKSIKTEKPLDENGEVRYKSNAEIIYEKLDRGEMKIEDIKPFTIRMFKLDLSKWTNENI
jgi:hypothetical protein